MGTTRLPDGGMQTYEPHETSNTPPGEADPPMQAMQPAVEAPKTDAAPKKRSHSKKKG